MRMISSVAIALLLSGLLSPVTVAARGWAMNGPADGVASQIVLHPTMPDVVYSMTRDGVARSVDGGQTWARTHEDRWSSAVGLVIDDANGALFVLVRWTVYPGLYRSLDDGATWSRVKEDVGGVQPYAGEDGRGVVVWHGGTIDVSLDGGSTWLRRTDDVDPEAGGQISKVVSLPLSQGKMYAIFRGWSSGSTIHHSDDGGRSWSEAEADFGNDVLLMASGPRASDPVFASVRDTGLFRSLDGGRRWVQVTTPSASCCIDRLEVSPHRPFELWAAVANDGLYRSDDAGQTWRREQAVGVVEYVQSIAFHPELTDTVFLGGTLLPHGIHRSDDHGVSWSTSTEGLPPVIVRSVTVDSSVTGTVYAAAELNGHEPGHRGGVYRSRDAGLTWHMLPGSETAGNDLAVDPRDANHLYAGSLNGLVQSFDGGVTWQSDSSTMNDYWVKSVTPDPNHPGTLFVIGSGWNGQSIGWRSDDDGGTWARAQGAEFLEFFFDPHDPDVVYGFGYLHLLRSNDRGLTWSMLYSMSYDWNPFLTDFAIDAHDSNRLLLAFDRGVMVSDDRGASWADYDDGLEIECRSGRWKQSQPVYCNGPRALVMSPLPGGEAFIATGLEYPADAGTGIYTTTADGVGWRHLSHDPDVSGGRDIAIGPDGRSVYLAAAQGGVAVLRLGEPRRSGGRVP